MKKVKVERVGYVSAGGTILRSRQRVWKLNIMASRFINGFINRQRLDDYMGNKTLAERHAGFGRRNEDKEETRWEALLDHIPYS